MIKLNGLSLSNCLFVTLLLVKIPDKSSLQPLQIVRYCEYAHVWFSNKCDSLGKNSTFLLGLVHYGNKQNAITLFFSGMCKISARDLLSSSTLSSAWCWKVRLLTTCICDFAFIKTSTFELSSRLCTSLTFEILIESWQLLLHGRTSVWIGQNIPFS